MTFPLSCPPMSFLDRFKRTPGQSETPAKGVHPAPVAPVPARLTDTEKDARPRTEVPPPTMASPGSPARSGPKHEIHLELGDFLPRITTGLLHDGPHADSTKLTFDIAELAERIARGQTSIRLAEIYRRAPEIFREEVPASDETEIRFPWQKVLRLLAAARAVPATSTNTGLTAEAADALAETLRSRRDARGSFPGADKLAGRRASVSPGAPDHAGTSDADAAEFDNHWAASPAGTPPASALPDEDNLTREELLRTRDAMRAQFRRAKNEHERQVALFAQERQKANEEKQRFVAEMVRLKKEADDKDGRVRFEKEIAAKTADTLAKVREANAALARQLAEATAGTRAEAGARSGEASREADELRQRISTLESNQRDMALELGREREAKGKLEGQLANAERRIGEGAAKLDEALAAARRDFETTREQRESETARALRDAQEKLTSGLAARERLAAELARVQAQLGSLSATASSAENLEAWEGRATVQLEADIENYRQRIKTLLGEKETLVSENLAQSRQLEELRSAHAQTTRTLDESRTAADTADAALRAEAQKLAGDLAGTRTTVEMLRAEMGAQAIAWSAERTKLTDELTAAREAHESAATAHRELQPAHERLAAEHAAANAALAQLRTELHQAGEALSVAQDEGRQARAVLAAQVAAAAAELAAAQHAHEAERSAHEAVRAAHEKAKAERTALAAQLADAQSAHAQAVAALTEESAVRGAKAHALHTELADLKSIHAATTETLRSATAGQASAAAEHTAREEQWHSAKTALEAQLAESERELAKLRARVQQTDVAVAGAEVAIRHHDEAVARLHEQHEHTLAAREVEHAAALAAAKTGHDQIVAALQARHEEELRGSTESHSRLTGEIARLTEAVATAQRESAAAAQSLTAANAEADRKFATYQRERDGLLAERRLIAAELETARDALKAQSVVFARDLKRARHQREAAAPEPVTATLREDPGSAPSDAQPKSRRARRDHGEDHSPVIEVAPAAAERDTPDASGRLKIQRVRPVPIRPPQVQSR